MFSDNFGEYAPEDKVKKEAMVKGWPKVEKAPLGKHNDMENIVITDKAPLTVQEIADVVRNAADCSAVVFRSNDPVLIKREVEYDDAHIHLPEYDLGHYMNYTYPLEREDGTGEQSKARLGLATELYNWFVGRKPEDYKYKGIKRPKSLIRHIATMISDFGINNFIISPINPIRRLLAPMCAAKIINLEYALMSRRSVVGIPEIVSPIEDMKYATKSKVGSQGIAVHFVPEYLGLEDIVESELMPAYAYHAMIAGYKAAANEMENAPDRISGKEAKEVENHNA